MNALIFFSKNQNKIKEINNFFLNSKTKIFTLKNLPHIKEPKESGNSFAENAKIKSLYGFKKFNLPCIADDSGICIDALNYKPGIGSKRFLKKFKNNKEAFNFIINKVGLLNKTFAYFKTSICLTLKNGHYIVFEGKISGNIARAPKGNNGFGYDPIFIPNSHNKTFAQMSMKQKNNYSHRGIAINKLKNFLSS